MTTTIITKNSSTASAVPLAADLVQGELAVNVADKRVFTKDASAAVVELGINPTSVTTGNVTISGTGKRITGDFTTGGVSAANRVMFQTSTVNGNTVITAMPNGTGTAAGASFYTNSSDPTNSSLGSITVGGARAAYQIDSTAIGTGTYLPITFYTGGSERVRLATDGQATFNGLTNFVSDINLSTGTDQYFYFDGALHISKNGTGERLLIDSSGNVLVTSPAGLGYGTGSGGGVTQATSKSTAVTLNKPTGQIGMNNAALAAGASVRFQVNNSLIASTDCVIINLQGGFANPSSYRFQVESVAAGSFYISVTNTTAGSLSEALNFNFALIKGVIA